MRLDFELNSGVSVTGRVLSPRGQPLRDYYANGLNSGAAGFSGFYPVKGDSFVLEGYFPAEESPRRVVPITRN